MYHSDLDEAPFGPEPSGIGTRSDLISRSCHWAADVHPDGREYVLAGPRVGIVDRIDPALRQRHRGITRDPVDLDVVALGLQVIDGGVGRLGAATGHTGSAALIGAIAIDAAAAPVAINAAPARTPG